MRPRDGENASGAYAIQAPTQQILYNHLGLKYHLRHSYLTSGHFPAHGPHIGR